MQKYLVNSLILLSLMSCASSKSVNQVVQNDIAFLGGNDGVTFWKENLVFKRTSWFSEARMVHDLFITEVKKDSRFKAWMGSAKDLLISCSKFYVGLIYNNTFMSGGGSGLIESTLSGDFDVIVLPDFRDNIRAHVSYSNLHLERHLLRGFCLKPPGANVKKIDLIVPGFKKVNLI